MDGNRRVELTLGGQPAFIATAEPWTISPASGPTIWMPTTRSLAGSTTSFIKVFSARPDSVFFSALKSVL